MKTLVRWLKLAAVLLAFVLGAWFALENSVGVQVMLLGWYLPTLPLGVWLLIFAVFGVLLGFGFSSLPLFRLRRQLKARERQLTLCETELTKLRTQPFRD